MITGNITNFKHWYVTLVCTFLALFTYACSKTEELRELDQFNIAKDQDHTVEVNFCTKPSQIIEPIVKEIYIIDKSGSNQQNYVINPDGSIQQPITILTTLATDPTGLRRYSDFISYLNSRTQDPNHFYSLINFSTNASNIPVNGATGFTSDVVAFKNIVQAQYTNLVDQGSTNYLDALDKAYQLIYADIQTNINNPIEIKSSTYYIYMISDGFPVMSISPTFVIQQPSDIIQKVSDIKSLEISYPQYVDGISIFTGYYYVTGNEDPNARTLLKNMADTGGGVAYTFGTGVAVDFSIFNVSPKVLNYNLNQIYISNESAVWWNGKFVLDNDGDGLPDEVETTLGSSVTKTDSDNNGVSDFVEFNTTPNHKPCNSATCAPANAINYRGISGAAGGCASITPISTANGITVFGDTDLDGLNDCEEMVLGNSAGIKFFDSNNNSIPDGLEYKNGLNFKAGVNEATGDNDLDSVNNIDEIRSILPITFPNNQILGLQKMTTDLQLVSQNSSQKCYKLIARNFPTVGASNNVKIQIIQSPNQLSVKPVIYVGQKPYDGNNLNINFNESGGSIQ